MFVPYLYCSNFVWVSDLTIGIRCDPYFGIYSITYNRTELRVHRDLWNSIKALGKKSLCARHGFVVIAAIGKLAIAVQSRSFGTVAGIRATSLVWKKD